MSLESTLESLERLAEEGDQAITKIREIAKNSQFLDANSIQMLETQVRASYTQRISELINTHTGNFNTYEEVDTPDDNEIAEALMNETETETESE